MACFRLFYFILFYFLRPNLLQLKTEHFGMPVGSEALLLIVEWLHGPWHRWSSLVQLHAQTQCPNRVLGSLCDDSSARGGGTCRASSYRRGLAA